MNDKTETAKQNVQESPQHDSKVQFFELQRVYVKALSLQIGDSAEAFLLKWEPSVKFELKVNSCQLKTPSHYEAIVDGTLQLSIADKEIATLKVEQAGIFKIEGFDEEQKKLILNGHCQDLLYPYFCNQVARMTTDAGFPALLLKPMSFVAIYQQNLHKIQTTGAGTDSIIVN